MSREAINTNYDKDVVTRVKAEAEQRGIPVSELMREIVDLYFQRGDLFGVTAKAEVEPWDGDDENPYVRGVMDMNVAISKKYWSGVVVGGTSVQRLTKQLAFALVQAEEMTGGGKTDDRPVGGGVSPASGSGGGDA